MGWWKDFVVTIQHLQISAIMMSSQRKCSNGALQDLTSLTILAIS